MKIQRVVMLMFVAAVLSLSPAAYAQEKSSPAGTLDESEALKAAQRWALLVSQADIAGLEQLLHNQYLHIHATALVESKGQFIDALKTEMRRYDPIMIEESNVRVFTDSALVTGKFNLKAFSRGKVIEGVNRFGMLLVKTENGLQVASYQATPIPQPKQ